MNRIFLITTIAAAMLDLRGALAADGPFLKPNDVIALVGGEAMVTAAEHGDFEAHLQRALPGHKLKVRSLAWEGDTVYEQRRDLNYPTLEQQLEEIGATVVIMQFGRMESLDGTGKLPEFIRAYEKLIERAGAGGKRRVVPVIPRIDGEGGAAYADAVRGLLPTGLEIDFAGTGIVSAARALVGAEKINRIHPDDPILAAIGAKNRLWFNYYRPQNWAFLAGDRTAQPSSRDHIDPTKRWFPEEMKQYLPLIEQKEKEIWALAAKAAKP